MENIIIRAATAADFKYAETITDEMEQSAKARGTGIARRSPDYIRLKMEEGKAVIALSASGEWVGFSYIESWQHEKFVANSGLIVAPNFRKSGVARKIKFKIFELSRKKYPNAKIFGLTTGLAVMKINSEIGYEPVTYSELTEDDKFWQGCKSCVNYDILISKDRKNCICTAMLYDPVEKQRQAEAKPSQIAKTPHKKRHAFAGNFKLFERWIRFKRFVLLRGKKTEETREKIKSFFNLFL